MPIQVISILEIPGNKRQQILGSLTGIFPPLVGIKILTSMDDKLFKLERTLEIVESLLFR